MPFVFCATVGDMKSPSYNNYTLGKLLIFKFCIKNQILIAENDLFDNIKVKHTCLVSLLRNIIVKKCSKNYTNLVFMDAEQDSV